MRSVSRLALAAALAALGCGNLSNDDIAFLSALPRAQDLKLEVPFAAAQTSCAIGSAAEWRKAKDAGDAINGGLGQVLAIVDAILGVSPTTRKDDLRVWGPFPDRSHPGVSVQVSILRFPPPPGAKSPEAWLYAFEEFREGVGWLTVLDGFFYGAQSKNGQGELTIHFDAIAALGTNNPGDPTIPITIHYDLTGDPRTIQLDVGSGGALGLDPFQYFYAGYASGSGRFEYAFTDASSNHLTIDAWFTAAGAGTATAAVRTALGAQASLTECWDANACLTYVQDPSLFTTYCGGVASCGSVAACPQVP
jgi:hypothetical protein